MRDEQVQAKLPFAELIFPFILLDLASHDDSNLWPLLTTRLDRYAPLQAEALSLLLCKLFPVTI